MVDERLLPMKADCQVTLSFELFVVSFMQEDVYIDHTALALLLSLQVFS